MNEIEFKKAVAWLNLLWPHQPVPRETTKAWWEVGMFEDLAAGDVKAAITALAATEEFSPTPGKIRAWIVRKGAVELDAVWAEVWGEILRERDRPGPWSKAQWSDAVKPFADHVGLTTLQELSHAKEIGTPLSVLEGQMRGKWEAWRNREQDRRATHSLPAVEAFLEAHDVPALPAPRIGGGAVRVGDIASSLRVLPDRHIDSEAAEA